MMDTLAHLFPMKAASSFALLLSAAGFLTACGGGGSSTVMTTAAASDDPVLPTTPDPMPPAPDPMPPAPDPVALAKQAVDSALLDLQRHVENYNKFTTDEAKKLLDNSIATFQEANESQHISQEDKTAYDERYLNIVGDYGNKDEIRGDHIDKNIMVTQTIDAIDNWNKEIDDRMDDGDDKIYLTLDDSSGFRDPMYTDVIDSEKKDGSTNISAYLTAGAMITDPKQMAPIKELSGGWQGKSFILSITGSNAEKPLKIFTDHMSGTPSSMFAGTWETFWDMNENRESAPDVPTTDRDDNPSKSGYFEKGYYKHVFGDSHVDILRAATGVPTQAGVDDKDFIRISESINESSMKNEPSAIHYTDISIFGEDLKENSLNIGINGLPNTFATLFKQQVTLGCSVFDSSTASGTPANFNTGANAGGCEVSLDSKGFLVVKHVPINDDGTTPTATNLPTIEANVIPANIARLTLTTTKTRSELESEEITLQRPDTSYTVMGYWTDKLGDTNTIDTFVAARYGPKGETGITSNIGRLKGTATYIGDSFGAYVLNTGDETNMDLYEGEFQADVNLTADFGSANYGSNDNAFTVEGTVDGFSSLTHNEHDLNDWTLTLNTSSVNKSDGSFSGTTTGDGKWQGQFYGTDMSGLNTAEVTDDFPVAAVGDFSGDLGNSNRVVGVFSGEKPEE